jgi:hypothetical protein
LAEPDPINARKKADDGLDELDRMFSTLGQPPYKLGTETGYQPPVHRADGLGTDGLGRAQAFWGRPISAASEDVGTPTSSFKPPGYKILTNVPGIPEYQNGHLLARALGGLGTNPLNLVPISPATNTAMRDGPEKVARDMIYPAPNAQDYPPYMLDYTVRCVYGSNAQLTSALTALGAGPNAAGNLMQLAMNNADLTDAVIQAAIDNPALTLTAAQSILVRKRLAQSFMPTRVQIRIEPIQGKNLNIQSFSIDNHKGVSLV